MTKDHFNALINMHLHFKISIYGQSVSLGLWLLFRKTPFLPETKIAKQNKINITVIGHWNKTGGFYQLDSQP